jgi:transmembrane sensor
VNRDANDNRSVEQVEEAAAVWLLKRESAQWSSADEVALASWLQSSPGHRVSFLRLQAAWQNAGRLKVLGGHAPRGVKRTADGRPSRRALYGLAASVLLAVALSGAFFASRWLASTQSYSTPIGGLASVPMTDGSRITLNTDSEIHLNESGEQRRVDLERGEAFFDVAPDPKRPFVVYARDKRVVAVGTKFSVRIMPDTVQVSVTEGRVRVEKAAVVGAAKPLADLIAGNVANADRAIVRIEQAPLADIERLLSWRSGYVVLSKAPLSDAVAEFNRYNRRQIVIADPSLAQIQVGGNFKSDNVDGFVRLLQEGFQVHAEQHEDRVILMRNGATTEPEQH